MSGKGLASPTAGKAVRKAHTFTLVAFVCIVLVWLSDGSGMDTGIRRLMTYRRSFLVGPARDVTGVEEGGEIRWISAPAIEPNYTEKMVEILHYAPKDPCQKAKTERVSIVGLDAGSPELVVGKIHRFVIRTYDEDGNPRCAGGDFFEVDLSGGSWKSRPPVVDHGDGTYDLSIQVHPNFSGDYVLVVRLIFRSYEGLKFHPNRFFHDRLMLNTTVQFIAGENSSLPELKMCEASDFHRDAWRGRWIRYGGNDTCRIDPSGRFRCLRPDYPCPEPWCSGAIGALESNGWVYSAHCAFRLFDVDSAWRCLAGRWLFFWGDSNHGDTIRNLLDFILGIASPQSVPRLSDETYRNPTYPSQSVRITNVFNGHSNISRNFEGLRSLDHQEYRDLVRSYLSGETLPDVIVMNSGLHDGIGTRTARQFADSVARAAEFWEGILAGRNRPEIVYRTTVAVGGYARAFAYNPHKMEVYNSMVEEGFRRKGLVSKVVDAFDMTFPWHYDNNCSDGPHYGRAPANRRWIGGQIGHQYFIDLMLVHVLLNAVCPAR